MRKSLLKLIRCIKCKGRFWLSAYSEQGDEIREGKLSCAKCGAEYPIISFVPRIMPKEIAAELVWDKYPNFTKKHGSKFRKFSNEADSTFDKTAKKKTSKSFGFEWKEFSEFHGVYRKQFLDWLHPFKPEMFDGKTVLDAGCGMGRHLMVVSEHAKEVVGIDFSQAVDAAYANLKNKENVHLVQADIYNLPFGRDFDLVYSIGVIHHLPNPEKGFRRLLNHVKPGGRIFVWVYGFENNFVMINIIEPLRKYFTSRLPHKALYYLSYPITALLELSCAFYRVMNAIPILNILGRHLPSNIYLLYISKFSFRHKLAIVFDFLSAPLARYYKKGEFAKWFTNANLNAKLFPHNQNSWKALAQVK